MKVLFISGGDSKYGAPKSMMTMLEGLKDIYGIEVILLTKKKNILNDYCDQHGIENYSLWYRDIMAGSPYSNKLLTVAKHIIKYCAFLWGALLLRLINNLPIDFSTVDIVHSNTNRQDIGAYIARKYHLKHICHIREMGKEDYNVIFYKRKCIQYMNKNADAFIMISEIVKEKWTSIGLNSDKAFVVYNGFDIVKMKKRAKLEKDKIKIVIMGHVQPNKGQLQLVKAVTVLPENSRNKVQLDIIGEAYPDYKKKIETLIKENSMENQIRLLGYQDNINEILSEYDIGVTCSRAEAFGRCTVEYMLAGLLTIASDTGANNELVENNVTGLLYKYNDIEQLTNAIQWGVTHRKESWVIAQAGCKAARSKFSKEQYVKDIYNIYEQCIATH